MSLRQRPFLNIARLAASRCFRIWCTTQVATGGDVCKEDWESNDEALKNGQRLLSEYKLPDGKRIWIITEWDRSATTLLFPEDY